MNERRFYVYVIFRLDGSPCYIGKGQRRRWLQHDLQPHKHCNRRLASLILKAKEKNKQLPRLKIRENLTNAEACEIEIALIAAIGRGRRGPLVNMTDGGEGFAGYKRSDELIKKAAKASASSRRGMKLGPMSQERRTAISIAKIGKKQSPETRAGRRGVGKDVPKSSEHRLAIGKANRLFWERVSPEQRTASIKAGWETRRANRIARTAASESVEMAQINP